MKVSEYGPEDAPVVLLLHGGGVAGWMWDSLQKVLEEKYKVIVPDLPGHGASSKNPYLSHDQTVAELQKVLAERGSNAVAVIGFSLGAQLAIALAAAEPGLVGKVMLISAQAKPMRFTKFTIGLLGRAAPWQENPGSLGCRPKSCLFQQNCLTRTFSRVPQSPGKLYLTPSPQICNLSYLPVGQRSRVRPWCWWGSGKRKSCMIMLPSFKRGCREVSLKSLKVAGMEFLSNAPNGSTHG